MVLVEVVNHRLLRMAWFDLPSTRNSRACAAHSSLHAELRQNPAVEYDPNHEETDDRESVFHGNDSL